MDISLLTAALSGALVALLLTLFGGGGSVLATPLLLYVVGVRDPHVAIGTSAAAVAVNAAVGLLAQAKAGRVKWPCALTFGAPGLVGSLLGAHLAKAVNGQHLLVWFALAMAAVGLSMFRAPGSPGDPDVQIDPAKAMRLVPVGAATGLAAGFFGIGGGFLIAPGLMAATGMTLANAAASSLVSVTMFGAATSLSYAASGLVDGRLFLALIAGGAAGVAIGAKLAPRLAARALLARRLFAVMIVATAGYVAWRALGGA
ncbi:sulfite exporter TauE/SafE family protein [Caulobacter vibrioides]|uniref:sulfite exporter TauE/SafE family protein n=1 Tax=Caulobacter vibrioides TaxID=155892 RepID=UPI000BB45B90|nr:sulfite exporter TauE/SafE family protein [Caulobacter vibrioides]ATC25766.1 sulfite exporter TauE/SafE family protein [Caulobacter vibrioides]AZH13911.1 sulfite exporter TauE/SafE family protein [Caulobacter vibrioides]PLR07609.1 sulfite exporter TauE/SafE family protein [Caulobacter vibrioides]